MQKYNSHECKTIHPELSAYLDNEVPLWKENVIRRHLKQCQNCASEVELILQTDRTLRFVTPITASETFLTGVLSRANRMNSNVKTKHLFFLNFGSLFEGIRQWLRGNVHVFNPVFMFGILFGVFIMIGITLYSPRIEKLQLFPQFNSTSTEVEQERLISFEVISQTPPKRTLKIR